ncbi:hypothetical protein [Primorskyibacter sp. S87]|uniref:hypothetical protein n=1 Tax=Primorskyibacter sp. S87 TaxID=3415126 RepID=UPI003C7CFF18
MIEFFESDCPCDDDDRDLARIWLRLTFELHRPPSREEVQDAVLAHVHTQIAALREQGFMQ